MAAGRAVAAEERHSDWHSPPEIIDGVHLTMGGIDLDPASSAVANRVVCAERFYSRKEDGLVQPWFGRVWLNPPYGGQTAKFVERFWNFYETGEVQQGIILLAVHHLTTMWFSCFAERDPIVCLPVDRLAFSGRGRPAHGSVILGVGVDRRRFEAAFGRFGQLWAPIGLT